MTKKRLWTCLAALACVFWGISGLFAKGLFNISASITPIWISQVRMVLSGILLLIFAQVTGKKPLKTMTDKKDAITVIGFIACAILLLYRGSTGKCFSCDRFTVYWAIFCLILYGSI